MMHIFKNDFQGLRQFYNYINVNFTVKISKHNKICMIQINNFKNNLKTFLIYYQNLKKHFFCYFSIRGFQMYRRYICLNLTSTVICIIQNIRMYKSKFKAL